MVIREVGSIRGHCCRQICLIGGQGETSLYESVCPYEMRGWRTLVEADTEAKRVVVTNCGEIKLGEDK